MNTQTSPKKHMKLQDRIMESVNPSGGDHHQEFDHEISNQQDTLVAEYRTGKKMKADVIVQGNTLLFSAEGGTHESRTAAFSKFLDALDSVDTLAREAKKRGKTIQRSFETSGMQIDPSPTSQELVDLSNRRTMEEYTEKSFDELSDEDDRSGAEDVGLGDKRGRKRTKLTSRDLLWYAEEVKERDNLEGSGRPSCQETQRLLNLYATDLQWVKRKVINSGLAPTSIPSGEWDAIFKGTAVNLDAVYSQIHHIIPPKEGSGYVGSSEIVFSNPEPSKKIRTAAQWGMAFSDVVKATGTTFPGHRREFSSYGDYLQVKLAAKQESVHPSIFLFDIAVRNFVAGGQRNLLTDFKRFNRFYEAIVMPDGVEAAGHGSKNASGSGSGSKPKSGRQGGSKRQICDRFNDPGRTCPNNATKCPYLHVCRKCSSSAHGERECDKEQLHSGHST
ncbi:hypothetical protein DXG01_009462 [Tephrocybe rancida]|nr:hypothetical protein DXG01_009462 [Tephrocybe rancida]